MSWTAMFKVGTILPDVADCGALWIGPGILELRLGPVSGTGNRTDALTHESSQIVVYRARLLPPWMNCSLAIREGHQTVFATFPIWKLRRMKAALEGVGFVVTTKVTRFERGHEKWAFSDSDADQIKTGMSLI